MSLRAWLLGILLQSAAPPEPDDLVVAAYPEGEAVGALWAGMLHDRGIHCMLRDVSPLYRGYMNWAAALELRVRYRDLVRAREILGVGEDGVPEPRRKAPRAPG
ncbi:MAG: hypothetical protein KGK07_13975 [Chloroflexota bacterium]|nr:hypothetical protein [Chloroflexota bacterium]